MAAGRMPMLSLPVESRSGVEFRAYERRTPVFTLNAGRALVSLTLPDRVRAEHLRFAQALAEQAIAYADEVERLYRSGRTARRRAA